jgi:outer membrane protein OmpA-like peptidoglycan-associated protein
LIIPNNPWEEFDMKTCFFYLTIVLLLCTSALFSQQESQGILAKLNQKLVDIQDRMQTARADKVHLLSPEIFEDAVKYLQNAKENLNKGKDVKGIDEKLERTDRALDLAERNAKEAKKQLPDLIRARDDAVIANAPEYAPDLYKDAEKRFFNAMKEIENNDINDAIKHGREGVGLFRQAELKAIKTSIIGNVHKLLQQADDMKADKFAPLTLHKAQVLLREAENILNSNRNAQATARQTAEQAEYQAKHAIYLTNLVQQHKDDDKSWEQLILSWEEAVAQAATEMQIDPRFDSGLAEPLQAIQLAIKSVKQSKKELSNELAQKNTELTEQRQTIQKLSNELYKTKEQEAGLEAKLEAEKRQAEKIKRVEAMFNRNEAIVLREGSNLILRLAGLSFPSGKSQIQAEYFGLLTKVQRAIREFDTAPIIIEGHTDALGHESVNMRLSIDRANAVKSYLIANMGLNESRVRAVGFGKTHPIASNETEQGRRKNRRIDVVLEIGEASY